MNVARVLAQSALDFLINERCHACGAAPGEPSGPLPPLASPLRVGFARLQLTTRILCVACAGRVLPWTRRILLPGRAGAPPLPLHAAFITDERVLLVIHLLKFGRRERIAPWLVRAMLPVLPAPSSTGPREPLIAPVPMDRAARARRGFNQAESMARILAAAWRLPHAPHALVKVRRTTPQSALDREQRLVNLRDAFRAGSAHVRGRSVILVDDLVTTGATAHACARALRRAGAQSVSVVCAGYRDQRPAQGVSAILTRTSSGHTIE